MYIHFPEIHSVGADTGFSTGGGTIVDKNVGKYIVTIAYRGQKWTKMRENI